MTGCAAKQRPFSDGAQQDRRQSTTTASEEKPVTQTQPVAVVQPTTAQPAPAAQPKPQPDVVIERLPTAPRTSRRYLPEAFEGMTVRNPNRTALILQKGQGAELRRLWPVSVAWRANG